MVKNLKEKAIVYLTEIFWNLSSIISINYAATNLYANVWMHSVGFLNVIVGIFLVYSSLALNYILKNKIVDKQSEKFKANFDMVMVSTKTDLFFKFVITLTTVYFAFTTGHDMFSLAVLFSLACQIFFDAGLEEIKNEYKPS